MMMRFEIKLFVSNELQEDNSINRNQCVILSAIIIAIIIIRESEKKIQHKQKEKGKN